MGIVSLVLGIISLVSASWAYIYSMSGALFDSTLMSSAMLIIIIGLAISFITGSLAIRFAGYAKIHLNQAKVGTVLGLVGSIASLLLYGLMIIF